MDVSGFNPPRHIVSIRAWYGERIVANRKKDLRTKIITKCVITIITSCGVTSEATWEHSSVPASQQGLGCKDICKILKKLDPELDCAAQNCVQLYNQR